MSRSSAPETKRLRIGQHGFLQRRNLSGEDVVSLSAEDAPGFDLSVTSATGEQFVVDVKGLACLGTPWLGIIKPRRRDLFYILVFVGADRSDDRFFILEQLEWNALVEDYQRNHPNDPIPGFLWDAPLKYEGQWERLKGNPGSKPWLALPLALQKR